MNLWSKLKPREEWMNNFTCQRLPVSLVKYASMPVVAQELWRRFCATFLAAFGFNGRLFTGSFDQRQQLDFSHYAAVFIGTNSPYLRKLHLFDRREKVWERAQCENSGDPVIIWWRGEHLHLLPPTFSWVQAFATLKPMQALGFLFSGQVSRWYKISWPVW